MSPLWLVLVALASLAEYRVESARILAMIPFPAKSHQRVIQPLLMELANRGHQIVCYTPHPPDNPPSNYKVVKIADYMPEIKKAMFDSDKEEPKEDYDRYGSKLATIKMVFMKWIGLHFFDWIMDQKEFTDLIKSDEKFDAIFMETTFYQESLIALSHRFNAPVIEFIPSGNILWSYWLHATPFDTNYFMEANLPYTDQMTFLERLHNTVLNGIMRSVWSIYYMPKFQKVMDAKLRYPGWESRPPMMDMIANTSLVLINTHYSVNYPYPYAPHVKEVGGLNIVPPKPLPKDLDDFMNSAKDGVIYFTLGSYVTVSQVLDDNLKDAFLKVFSELKQKVLWKWETDFPNLPPNIRVSKWFPQQDILAHKNIRMFITHGGFLSTTEAAYQGVPTIGIPLIADQFKNVARMQHYKYGIPLFINNITYSSLKWAINEILNNKEYSENAKKQSMLFRDKPETALETAVYWSEYVLRHKGAHHLKPAISTMPWYQQAMIDVYAALLLIVLIPIYTVYKIIKCFISCICCRSNKKTHEDKNKKNK